MKISNILILGVLIALLFGSYGIFFGSKKSEYLVKMTQIISDNCDSTMNLDINKDKYFSYHCKEYTIGFDGNDDKFMILDVGYKGIDLDLDLGKKSDINDYLLIHDLIRNKYNLSTEKIESDKLMTESIEAYEKENKHLQEQEKSEKYPIMSISRLKEIVAQNCTKDNITSESEFSDNIEDERYIKYICGEYTIKAGPSVIAKVFHKDIIHNIPADARNLALRVMLDAYNDSKEHIKTKKEVAEYNKQNLRSIKKQKDSKLPILDEAQAKDLIDNNCKKTIMTQSLNGQRMFSNNYYCEKYHFIFTSNPTGYDFISVVQGNKKSLISFDDRFSVSNYLSNTYKASDEGIAMKKKYLELKKKNNLNPSQINKD